MAGRGPVLKVEGAARLRATMKAASVDLTTLKEAHSSAAAIVAGAGRPAAPRRSGALAATIRPAGTKTGAVVRAGGAAVPYANVIHWGWRGHGIEANPFLLRAAETSSPAWTAAYLAAVNKILSTIHGK